MLLRRITTSLDDGSRCSYCKFLNLQSPVCVPSFHNEPVVLWDSLTALKTTVCFSLEIWLGAETDSFSPTAQLSSEAKSIPISRSCPGKYLANYLKIERSRDILDVILCEEPWELFSDVLCADSVSYLVPGPRKVAKKKNHTDLIPQKAHSPVGP